MRADREHSTSSETMQRKRGHRCRGVCWQPRCAAQQFESTYDELVETVSEVKEVLSVDEAQGVTQMSFAHLLQHRKPRGRRRQNGLGG